MMYIQSRKRKTAFPFSSFLSNSFSFFSLHFPLNLNCQTNCKRRKLTPSEDPNSELSSSSTATHGGDHEGGNEQLKGNAYEVFLSFRGTDTRKSFTDYLYTSLVDAGIHVFRDDNKLRVGEEIGPELLHSIKQSAISIPIISENYASSKWCLRELAQILKCKRSRGQIVLPIFYKVEPSQVRHLKGRFGDAINAHKKDLAEKVVKEWVEALQEVGSLKGWESEKIENGHEGAFVKNVVTKVMGELKRAFQLIIPQQLVGIDDHIKKIMSFTEAKFNRTWFIGIHGMGGIGKTTLAKALYNKLSGDFEYRRFVADCRETYKRKGIKCLQKQLLSDHGSSHDVSNVDEGIHLLKILFANKKALIFLDDVDSDYWKYLVDHDWFKAGSMVIITTRNKDVLCQASADLMYRIKELSLDQSLILFSRHAFRRDSPPSDHEAISRGVVSTTGGLPLALEVIGSFLCGKGENVWKDALKKLNKVPHEKVRDKLKISYEALSYEQQQIFLDIACLFIGSKIQNPIYMWDACDFFPGEGIEVLSLMSLIKIECGRLLMHDQLRDLGREIIFQQNPKEPQEWTRLWNYKEALDVLDNFKTTRKIEALSLDNCERGRRFVAEQFKEMTNLRFLRVDHANFIGDFQSLLPRLRWLQWRGCPSDFVATNFHLKNLVVLDLSYSAISEDWGGWVPLKKATELKVLDLEKCLSLERTPELSTFVRLEVLKLEFCWNLKELHPSIGNLASLIELDLRDTSITKLPESIGNLQNLRILRISGSKVMEWPNAIEMLAKLQLLEAGERPRLEVLRMIIRKVISLEKLNLARCGKLRKSTELPSGLTIRVTCKGPSLPRLSQLTRLESLHLDNCRGLECVPELPIGLSVLIITGCGKLKAANLSTLIHLRYLLIMDCGKLKASTMNLSDLKHLRYFRVLGCPSLEGSPEVMNFRPAEISADP